jgi:hypothetical protein
LSTVTIAWFMPQARPSDDLVILSPVSPVALTVRLPLNRCVAGIASTSGSDSHDLNLDRGIIGRRRLSYTLGAVGVGLRTGGLGTRVAILSSSLQGSGSG